jgi:hypothetical protein
MVADDAPISSPAARNGVIIIAVPHGGWGHTTPTEGGRQSIGAFGQSGAQDADTSAQLATAKREMTDIRGFFDKLGVKGTEGNDETQVSVDPSFDNAEYNTETDSVKVGVDPTTGESYTQSPDVLAHEWSHRIIHHLAFTDPKKTTASDLAIDESLADTFAAAYDQKNWTIGEGVGRPVRDMAHPEADENPTNMADVKRMFQPGVKDSEGHGYLMPVARDRATGKVYVIPEPHRLSSVPSLAASMIGDKLGRDTMAKIYMDTVRNHLHDGSTLQGLAKGVVQSATDLFGATSKEAEATKQAWTAVGLLG